MAGTVRNGFLAVILTMGTGLAVSAQPGHPGSAGAANRNDAVAAPAPDPGWPPPGYWQPPGYAPVTPRASGYDPALEEVGIAPPGWYASMDTDFTAVHFKNGLASFVPVSPSQTDLVHVPSPDLDWAVAPRFEAGYRLPRGYGEVAVAYRFVATDGSGAIAGALGTTALKSHFDENALDLLYANRQFLLGPGWELRWKVGVELYSAYFDARGALPTAGGAFEQRVSDRFIGAGPLAGLEIERRLAVPGLALYGQVEGASIWGRVRQNFEETTTPASGAFQDARAQGSGIIRVQAGLIWIPSAYAHSRFSLGYQWEGAFQVGRNDVTGSTGDVTENGIFVRGEFRF